MTLGTKVSVGTGFTADERLRYAEDPSLIVSPPDRGVLQTNMT